MKEVYLLAVFAALIFLLSIASAQEATLYNVDFKIISEKVLATYIIAFEDAKNIDIEIDLPKDARAIEVYADKKKIEPEIKEGVIEEVKKLHINTSAKELKIAYITEQFLEGGRKNYFIAEISIPLDTNLEVKLTLPTGAVLYKLSSAFPKPTSISTDGQHIALLWEKQDLLKEEGFSIFVIFTEKGWAQNTAIMAIAIAIIALSLLLALRKKKTPYLIESEKAVVDALRKAKGELWQKQIQQQTGFSKAKLSRLINNLEVRGALKKIPIGNTNKIRLTA